MKLTISLGLTPEEVEAGVTYSLPMPGGENFTLSNEAAVCSFDLEPVEPVEPVEPPTE